MAVQLIWKELFGDDRNMEGEMVVPRGRSGEEGGGGRLRRSKWSKWRRKRGKCRRVYYYCLLNISVPLMVVTNEEAPVEGGV